MKVVSILSGQDTLNNPSVETRAQIRSDTNSLDPVGGVASPEGWDDGYGAINIASVPVEPTTLLEGPIWVSANVLLGGIADTQTDNQDDHFSLTLTGAGGDLLRIHDFDNGTYRAIMMTTPLGATNAIWTTVGTYKIDICLEYNQGTGDLTVAVYSNGSVLYNETGAVDASYGSLPAEYIKFSASGTLSPYGYEYKFFWAMCLSSQDTRGLYLKAILPETDGSFNDFSGTVTDINEVNTTPSSTLMHSANVGDIQTYKNGITDVEENGLEVVGMVMAKMVTAAVDSPGPSVVDVVYDGTTVTELGVPTNVVGRTPDVPLITQHTLNPLTGKRWTMSELRNLEFGIQTKE